MFFPAARSTNVVRGDSFSATSFRFIFCVIACVKTHSIAKTPDLNSLFSSGFSRFFQLFLTAPPAPFSRQDRGSGTFFPSLPMPLQTASQLIFSAANPRRCLVPTLSQLQPFFAFSPLTSGAGLDLPVFQGRSKDVVGFSCLRHVPPAVPADTFLAASATKLQLQP